MPACAVLDLTVACYLCATLYPPLLLGPVAATVSPCSHIPLSPFEGTLNFLEDVCHSRPGSACTSSPGSWDLSAGCSLGCWESREHMGSSKELSAETQFLLHKPAASRQHLNYNRTA